MTKQPIVIEEGRAARLIAMGQMAASMAHEIRNPLGSLELFCSLLKKDLVAQPELFELASQMHESIKALDRIIANCLEFTRERRARAKPIPQPERLLEEVLRDARPHLESAGITISSEARGEHGVAADPYLIKQALLNLVLNAADACAERAAQERLVQGTSYSPAIRLVSDTSDSQWWAIHVTDNGTGLSNEAK
ncbi:MAG: hypothetical protein KDD44_10320, partial [Bdellovibrionales bacterium]|nr:hypothetical protein [Bdellovibrionales bacterium]